MAESLAEVIARMKAGKTSVKPLPTTEPVVEEPLEDDEDYEDEEETEEPETIVPVKETPKAKEKPVEVKVNSENTENKATTENINGYLDQQTLAEAQQYLQQVESLQNNGAFRLGVLTQLEEIKRALVVIAGALVDITEKK